MQRQNGVKAGSKDNVQINSMRRKIDISAEVISEMMKDYLEKARFFSVSGDDSKAKKTGAREKS